MRTEGKFTNSWRRWNCGSETLLFQVTEGVFRWPRTWNAWEATVFPVEELRAQFGQRRRLLLAQLRTIFGRGVDALLLDSVKRTHKGDGLLRDLEPLAREGIF
jgi:hypothetical protein